MDLPTIPLDKDYITLPTIPLSCDVKKENLRISHISFFDDDDEHGTIFLEGWQNWEVIQRVYMF